ncbi:MAG: MogA/MoaB family molybdenum cofactor biosynthesis protein [Thermodesulfobacteriota bacterium]|nr:MogA/MoaB family molybdenum cofactor biosynthesis protein [Thermodesulfobacteriota bacterium]
MRINRGAGILTISDKAYEGRREDASGLSISRMLEQEGYTVLNRKIIPDDLDQIVKTLVEWADTDQTPLIITSGGTGLSPRDLTPQAMKRVIDYEVPGMAEAMRAASLKKTPHAMISRAVVGVRGASLIVNLPGSPRGAEENLSVLFPALVHALAKLQGDPSECAQ